MSVVLVVDDDEESLTIIERMLRKNGHDVLLARTGKEALEVVESKAPQLVLLDILMPGMSGIQVLERLRSSPRSSRIPVVLLTAKAQDEDVLNGYQFGADYYITKPFTVRQLLYGMRLVLGREGTA
jgi:two-component system, OmpR family, alkaline phosphatase synthesis response regulator PhoP